MPPRRASDSEAPASRTRRTRAACLAWAALALGPISLASARQQAPPPAETPTPALEIRSAGLTALLPDPRDEGLRRLLERGGERIRGLLEDFDADASASAAAHLLLELAGRPMDLQVTLPANGRGGPASLIPIVHWNVEGARTGDAQRWAESLRELLATVAGRDLPWKRVGAGLDELGTPFGNLRMGPVAGPDPGEGADSFTLALGSEIGGPEVGKWAAGALPPGVPLALAWKLDFGPLQRGLDSLLDEAGPEAAIYRAQLAAMGAIGDSALSIRSAVGHGSDRMHWVTRYGNWAQMAREAGVFTQATLQRKDLERIPFDATAFSISKSDASGMLSGVSRYDLPEAGGMDPVELIATLTGVDLQLDLLDHLGLTSGWYTSEGTGGGGLLSWVFFCEVADPEGLAHSLLDVAATINRLAGAATRGHVRIQSWERGEVACASLRCPELPIPLELSYAQVGDQLLFALTPQALAGALDHAQSEDRKSILADPTFREAAAGRMDGLTSLTYCDNASRIRSGYGTACLAAAALTNLTRSTDDRDPQGSLALPPFGELMRGVRPSITFYRLEGEDLVARTETDRSWTAGVTSMLGGPIGGVVLIGAAGGFAVPFLMANAESARSEAERSASLAQAWDMVRERDQRISEQQARIQELATELARLREEREERR